MTDLQLFRGIAKIIPLEPIADAETYFAACDFQSEHRDSTDWPTQIYLQALEVFLNAYQNGYRPEDD